MVIFVKPNGSTVVENDVIALGTTAGKIAIVAQSRPGAFVEVMFSPPSGVIIPPVYAAPMMTTDAEDLGIYLCDIAHGVASVSGKVRYQISFTNSGGGKELTPEGTFTVQPGVVSLPPENPTQSMYNEIRSAMIAASANYTDVVAKLDKALSSSEMVEINLAEIDAAKKEALQAESNAKSSETSASTSATSAAESASKAETEADRAKSEADRAMESDPTVPAWAKKPNPPTPAEIGAAPAGFGGFGEQLVSVDYYENESDLNNALSAVLSTIRHGSSVQLKLTPIPKFGLASGTLVRVDSSYAYLDVYGYGFSSLHKNLLAGVWQPWEWVNPPMQQGIEYRTTERWMGKPVYAKAVYCGFAPAATRKEVEHGCVNVDRVIDHGGYMGDHALPFEEASGLKCYIADINRSAIALQTSYDWSKTQEITIWMKYTKSVD